MLLFLRYLMLHDSDYSTKPSSGRTKFSNKAHPEQRKNCPLIIKHVCINYLYNFTISVTILFLFTKLIIQPDITM